MVSWRQKTACGEGVKKLLIKSKSLEQSEWKLIIISPFEFRGEGGKPGPWECTLNGT